MPQQTSGTEVKGLTGPSPLGRYQGYILHASGQSGDIKIHWSISTSTFVSAFNNFLAVLLEIIKEQGKQLEFDGYYISYLLGHLSEEEFEEISKTFVSEIQDTPLEILKDKVRVLHALRGHDITIREMAQYLHCDEDAIMNALRLLQG